MITRIALHVIAPENRDRAIDLFRRNGEMMRRAKGFISREVYFATDDPITSYCISTFATNDDWNDYFKLPNRPNLIVEGDEKRLYEQTPEGRFLLFTHTAIKTFERDDGLSPKKLSPQAN